MPRLPQQTGGAANAGGGVAGGGSKGGSASSGGGGFRTGLRFQQRPGSGSVRHDKHGNMSREVTMYMQKGREAASRVTINGIPCIEEAQCVWDLLNVARHLIHKQDPSSGTYNFHFEHYRKIVKEMKQHMGAKELRDYVAALLAARKLQAPPHRITPFRAAALTVKQPTTQQAQQAQRQQGHSPSQQPALERPEQQRKRGKQKIKVRRTQEQYEQQQQQDEQGKEQKAGKKQKQNGSKKHKGAQEQGKKRKRQEEEGGAAADPPPKRAAPGSPSRAQKVAPAASAPVAASQAPAEGAAALPQELGNKWAALNQLRPLLRAAGVKTEQESSFTAHFGYAAGRQERQALYDTLRRALLDGNNKAVRQLVRRAGSARE